MDLSKLRKSIPKTKNLTLPIIRLVKRRDGETNGIEQYDIEEDVRPLRWSRPSIYGDSGNPIND